MYALSGERVCVRLIKTTANGHVSFDIVLFLNRLAFDAGPRSCIIEYVSGSISNVVVWN